MIGDALLTRWGVDPVQWRALMRVALRIDFPIVVAQKSRTERHYLRMLGGVILLYALAGFTPAFVAFWSPDPLLAGASLSTIVTFMVASTLLMGEGSNIVSPGDHDIIGFRPVSSRTYLAVRVSGLLIRSCIVAGAVALAPMVVALLRRGIHPGPAFALFLTAEMTGVAIALAVAAMYGWALRTAGPQRVLRYTTYLQFVASTITWIGMLAVSQGLSKRALAGASLAATDWWIALPMTWFGSYALLAAGQVTAAPLLAALLSIATIALFGWLLRDKLSLSYVESLKRLATSSAPATTGHDRRWMAGLNHETRAVAILVRSQLEHDMKFRMGLISMLPLTLFYLYLGGWPHDPFVAGGRRGNETPFIQLALVFMPMTLRQVIVSSESYRASWIFHTTPADRGRLVLSARNLITAFFLLPYLALLAIVFAYAYVDSTHALVHTFFLGLVSWLVLQMHVMMSPQLPFSMAHGKDTAAGMQLVRTMVAMLVGMAGYFVLVKLVYRSPARMVPAAAVLVLLGLAMSWLTRRRATRRPVEQMYFE